MIASSQMSSGVAYYEVGFTMSFAKAEVSRRFPLFSLALSRENRMPGIRLQCRLPYRALWKHWTAHGFQKGRACLVSEDCRVSTDA